MLEKLDNGFIVELFGGLHVQDEWPCWRNDVNLFPSDLVRGDDDAEIAADLTGRLPLLLRDFNNCANQARDEARDSGQPIDVGSVFRDSVARFEDGKAIDIEAQLTAFTNWISNRGSADFSCHINLMSSALIECATTHSAMYYLYDQRYFYRDGRIVRPVSGLVRRIMARILRNLKNTEYISRLDNTMSIVTMPEATSDHKKAKVTKKVMIIGVQVTLKNFNDHSATLRFFTDDCYKQWVRDDDGDALDLVLLWVGRNIGSQNRTIPKVPGAVAFRQLVHIEKVG